MSARETILNAVRRQAERMPLPDFTPPSYTDAVGTFVTKATSSYAQVHRLASVDEIPQAVFAVLTAAGSEAMKSLAVLWR